MPKKTRKDYSENWEEISYETKKRDGFQCRICKLQFVDGSTEFKNIVFPIRQDGKLRRLTVHHRDRDTRNNNPNNLVSLCCACHCREEWPLIRQELATKATQAQVANGQQLLF